MKKFSDTAFFLLSRTALLLLAAVTGGTAYCELSMLSRARVQQFDIFVQSEEKTMVQDLKHFFKTHICLSACLPIFSISRAAYFQKKMPNICRKGECFN